MTEFCLKILISFLDSFFAWNLSYLLLATNQVNICRSLITKFTTLAPAFFTFAKKKVELDCQIGCNCLTKFSKDLVNEEIMSKISFDFYLKFFKIIQVEFFKIPLLCQLMFKFSKSFKKIRKLKGLSLM